MEFKAGVSYADGPVTCGAQVSGKALALGVQKKRLKTGIELICYGYLGVKVR